MTTISIDPHIWRARRTAGTILSALLAVTLLAAPAVAFATDEDPNLDQTLEDLAIVHGDRVLDAGHVDMGPKFDNGQWRFLIHDDVARADAGATSVWRYPDETVFHVLDQGTLTVPDDPAYAFLGAEPGSGVWVVPQTQNSEVVWLGWNTQDPEVMQTIDRGVTLTLTGVQGPGIATVYLQSGSFGEPQMLWDSRVPDPQPLWVDVNTHTHANWVFTEPGIYLMQLEASAELLDGSTVTDTQVLRFAVGTGTAPDDAFAAPWDGTSAPDPAEEEAPSAGGGGSDGSEDTSVNPLVPVLIGVIVLVAAGLIVGSTIVVVRGNRARKKALAARTPSPGPADGLDVQDGEDR